MVAEPVRRRSRTNPRNVIVEFTRSIIDRVIERPERVNTAEIREQVMDRFGKDQDFLLNLALLNVEEIISAAIREAIAETRKAGNMRERMVLVKDEILTEQEHLAQAPALMQALALRWGRFREWDGEHQILLVKMKKPELLAAARIRRARASHELGAALFLERLAARLPDDITTVDQVVPFDQIEAEHSQAEEDARKEVGGDATGPTDS